MAYRNIMIENPARISVNANRLIIHTDKDHAVPLEDISALLLEDNRSTITTAALSLLGQCGCAVFICDGKHLPCAVLTPFSQHSRSLSVLRRQIAMTEPRKKQLWQSIVQCKLENQSRCLALAGKEESSKLLRQHSGRVRSGDSENVEATGAQMYFPALFGDGFTRNEESGQNAALNYGYAILRGAMARLLCVYGFYPSIGIHHSNQLNSFNLADDLMEPFRPVVDRMVWVSFQDAQILTPQHKRQLFNCLNLEIISGGQRHSVAYAMERLVKSLAAAVEEKDKKLILPELMELRQHTYE